ncbi:MAG: response regulator transcription factor [Candidatus Solibacter usitatus]|nr:response regulator transcription factor [Candidatus Solibacter usitatus]
MGPKILLVEDEPGLVMTLTDRLQGEGYLVDSAMDGESGLTQASGNAYDLIILDVMLPRKSGLDICRKLRQGGVGTPVLMLTARSQIVDKVVGLQIGADDYMTKPFDMMELLARIEALLRRAPAKAGKASPSYQFGSVHVDFRSAEVTREGKPLALSAREFHLLRYLIEHRGSTLSREELLKEVWGYDAGTTTRTVDVHMAWLRQKVEENSKIPQYILTVRGFGYKFTG